MAERKFTEVRFNEVTGDYDLYEYSYLHDTLLFLRSYFFEQNAQLDASHIEEYHRRRLGQASTG